MAGILTWWQGIILGIIQGIAEWFPISSSGHLVIAQQLMGIEVPVFYDIVLHLGSVICILIVFRKDIIDIIKKAIHSDQETWKFLIQMLIATIPVAIVGVLFDQQIEATFSELWVVGVGLLITGVFLFISRWPIEKNKELSNKVAVIVGLFQAVSIFPGVSRSGSTTVGGLIQGIKPQESGRFAFLLSIPAILGSFIFKIHDLTLITSADILPLVLALIITIVLGVIILRLVMVILMANKYNKFMFYCWIVGILVLILSVTLK
jgi:undecaprenyl-diphosphatase